MAMIGPIITAAPVCPNCAAEGSFLRGYKRGSHEMHAWFDCGSSGIARVARSTELEGRALDETFMSALYPELRAGCANPEVVVAPTLAPIGPRLRIQRDLAQ